MKIIHRSILLVLSLTALYGQLTVNSVNSANANGTYSKGDGPIDINVTLGETVVVVSGTPQLTLETGLGTDYPADAVAVSVAAVCCCCWCCCCRCCCCNCWSRNGELLFLVVGCSC